MVLREELDGVLVESVIVSSLYCTVQNLRDLISHVTCYSVSLSMFEVFTKVAAKNYKPTGVPSTLGLEYPTASM